MVYFTKIKEVVMDKYILMKLVLFYGKTENTL